MNKELVINLSKKVMISLNETEVEQMRIELALFEKAVSELYNADTSNYLNTHEVSKTANISSLRDANEEGDII